jgi:hypothetical protein
METVAEAKAGKQAKEQMVGVLYNGLPKPVEFRHGERVKELLDRAMQVHGPIPQPHVMSLFNKAGDELQDGHTVDQAGVRPGDELLLRPSVVKGG